MTKAELSDRLDQLLTPEHRANLEAWAERTHGVLAHQGLLPKVAFGDLSACQRLQWLAVVMAVIEAVPPDGMTQ